MKRDKNIVPLSQDHHFGLLSGWKIKQGIKKNISYERIKNYINYHWDNSQSFHFDEEEKILLRGKFSLKMKLKLTILILMKL